MVAKDIAAKHAQMALWKKGEEESSCDIDVLYGVHCGLSQCPWALSFNSTPKR
tara:strand:+ start:331 stop:489 length:159 start_codon:yes stop_codon:yes gene_type:complete